ncbi:MAG: rhomboid family intramembrane serine protease [Sphaerochaetaceae bacterium]
MANTFLNRKFRYTYTNVTLRLVVLNVLFFIVAFFIPRINNYLALVPAYVVQRHWYWQFITYMFVHGGFTHLFFNMLGLLIFGMPVERRLGSREFLLFYLLVGALSGLFSFFAYLFTGKMVVLVGASGAIYGVLLAFAVLYPRALVFIFGIIPVRAPFLVIGYALIEIFNQVSGSRQGVAHLTHLAGFAFAYLYFRLRLRIKPLQEWRRNG